MTRNPQLDQLLNELPDERLPELLDFLRRLTHQSSWGAENPRTDNGVTHAQHTFGLIPADPATVRQLLAEDLYDLG
jgi:hypothetical protein